MLNYLCQEFAATSTILAYILLAASLVHFAGGRTQCVHAKGRVVCPTDPGRQYNILVKLMDKDALPWETDDQMAKSWTDEFGNYTLEGCGDDLGEWNDPDPYILIEHRCPRPGLSFSLPRRYQK